MESAENGTNLAGASPVLVVDSLSKSYGKFKALQNASLTVERGDIVGLVGPNGAGKTTLIECVAGVKKPDTGRVSIAGVDALAKPNQAARHYGVQFQEAGFLPSSHLADVLWLWKGLYDAHEPPAQLCDEFSIGDKYKTAFRKLSGGQKRRALVAVAFIGKPKLAILDEPTSGMDPHSRDLFWDAVRQRTELGTSVLITSHELIEMDANCNKVAIIFNGEIRAFGNVRELLKEHGAFRTFITPLPARDALDAVGGVTWVARVQGQLRMVASEALKEAELKQAVEAQGIQFSSAIYRPSNVEDLFYMLVREGIEADSEAQ